MQRGDAPSSAPCFSPALSHAPPCSREALGVQQSFALPDPHSRRFHMDPSGTFVQCDARAIGSASEGAQSSLQEVYHKVTGCIRVDT